mgnify:CR=1 FL=1
MGTVSLRRTQSGISLTELVVTAVILIGSMAVFGELAVLITVASMTTTNKVDGLAAARSALNRISADVRQARCIGDGYANGANRLVFPASNNPKYASNAPPGGWPAAPWSSMILGPSILILQVPVLYKNPGSALNGVPTILPKNHFGAGSPPTNMANVDTIVYEVLADPLRAGEYQLKVARFPGEQLDVLGTASAPMTAINPPQTILRGLVGPTGNGSAMPIVFSYFAPSTSDPPNTKVIPSAANAERLRGVGIDLEVKNTGLAPQQGDGRFPQFFGVHTEAFIRNSRNMTMQNIVPVQP